MSGDALTDWSSIIGSQLAKDIRLFVLHAACSYSITVSRQIYFHTTTLSVHPLIFYQRRSSSFLVSLSSPDQTSGPTSHPSLFSSLPSPRSSFFYLCLIEVSGGSRGVTAVCLPGPAVCLSNEPQTQGVSLLWRWGDPGRPKGDGPL